VRAGWGIFLRRGPFRFWVRWDLTRWIVLIACVAGLFLVLKDVTG
jgi:hypothetical protein